ncbi:MAG: efflux RND transporter permease subunit, partial [Actinomycetota bacterium]
FPPINTPISIVSGTYFVDDPARVDTDVLAAIEPDLAAVDGVVETSTRALPNAFVAIVEFESSISSEEGTTALRSLDLSLPDAAIIEFTAIDDAKFAGEFDLFVSVVDDGADPATLQARAAELAAWLEADDEIAAADVQELLTEATSPSSGAVEVRQTSFSRVALDPSGFREAVNIGIVRASSSDLDVLEFSDHVNDLLDDADAPVGEGTAAITADFATGVRAQLDSLTTNLIGGLVAVVVVGLVMIGWRAAALKAGFMVLVVLGALVGLWAIGYTLNTITLFGLILTLGLLVDNAVVVTEAIDASTDEPDPREMDRSLGVVRTAIDRIGSATLAGTLTTIVVFSPMLLIGGILGEFVRPIPTTVIITLATSFVLAMVAIPVLGRRLLARGAGRALAGPAVDTGAAAVARLARFSTGTGAVRRATGAALVALSLVAVFAGVQLASRLDFSIFPAGKDANGLIVAAEFDPGTAVQTADELSARIDDAIVRVVSGELVRSQYVTGDDQELEIVVDLTPLDERDVTAPELVEELEVELGELDGARIAVTQVENGPPIADFPFAVQVSVDDDTLDAGRALAEDIRTDLLGRSFRSGGDDVEVVDAIVSTDGEVARLDGGRFIEVRAKYADTTGLTGLLSATEDHVRSTVPALDELGLAPGALAFDFGEESDNQDDFAALSVAGVVALVLVLTLIAIQFRSVAQSLLVFLAIPFSFLGVTGILTLTDNPLSFLAAIGFIALIGVSVNNTILLVDAANRARRAGSTASEAIAEAIGRRFRALVTTTLTTLAGLLPLTLADPFWESLGFTLMGGLVTSTVLVLVSFPVYFVTLEAVRDRTSAAARRVLRRPHRTASPAPIS